MLKSQRKTQTAKIMSPSEANNPTLTALEKCNVDETEDKDFKIAIINVLKDP